MKLRALCVYCGSSPGRDPAYRETAYSVGQLLAAEGITLVYGGGNIGLMGAVADGALAAGGRVIGVIPAALVRKELAHEGLTELHEVPTMHARKERMAAEADAFLALPGGLGTLEEIFEALTWTQLKFHEKPCAFLNVRGYYTPLFGFLRNMTEARFLRAEHLDSIILEEDAGTALERLRGYRPITDEKWIDELARTRGPGDTPGHDDRDPRPVS